MAIATLIDACMGIAAVLAIEITGNGAPMRALCAGVIVVGLWFLSTQ